MFAYYKRKCLYIFYIDIDELLIKGHGINMAGIHTPFTYIGSIYSTFCVHEEDGGLGSINYLHQGKKTNNKYFNYLRTIFMIFHRFSRFWISIGKPKIWYFITKEDAERLEVAVKDLYKGCDFPIRHKISVVPPETLKKLGIPYCRVWFYIYIFNRQFSKCA